MCFPPTPSPQRRSSSSSSFTIRLSYMPNSISCLVSSVTSGRVTSPPRHHLPQVTYSTVESLVCLSKQAKHTQRAQSHGHHHHYGRITREHPVSAATSASVA